MISARIARLQAQFKASNALNVRTVVIFIQKYPGKPYKNRVISGLDYEVKVNDRVTQTGRTTSVGTITVRIPSGTTPVLKVMGTEYRITADNAKFAKEDTTKGKKERLRYLGYQIGHEGN
ncbi:MAG: hypothetical protein KJ645_01105, partial [Planctomycetes bacterium]|nr:hypothetical protein [Planctomycetota bacterium]